MNFARWTLRAVALFVLLVVGFAIHATNVTTVAKPSRSLIGAGEHTYATRSP